MSTVISRPRPARAAPPQNALLGDRRDAGRAGRRSGADGETGEGAPRRPAVLRCPGPLVALRGLAALYRTSPTDLTALLPECETRARTDPHAGSGALGHAVSEILGAPLAPVAVHLFHVTWLADPAGALRDGVSAPPGAAGAVPRSCLIRDVLLRPALYGTRDPFEDADRRADAATPCIVEYRVAPGRDGAEVDAALWFVAAALRGAVSPWATGGRVALGAPIAADDIVSVRSIATQAEWTPDRPPA